jgi:hypothetical protein
MIPKYHFITFITINKTQDLDSNKSLEISLYDNITPTISGITNGLYKLALLI